MPKSLALSLGKDT